MLISNENAISPPPPLLAVSAGPGVSPLMIARINDITRQLQTAIQIYSSLENIVRKTNFRETRKKEERKKTNLIFWNFGTINYIKQ